MKKIVMLAFVLVLFSTVTVIEVTIRVVSYPAEIDVLMEVDLPVHNLDSGKNFSTIHGAINDNETLDGHTILVNAGEYYENLIVDKALSLIGENKNTTIIDGSKSRSTIYVEADNVEIIGFKIQHGYEQGVFVESSHGTIISGNVITLNIWNGIRTLNCTGVTVSENEIISNPDWGVRVISSSGTNISNNKVSDNGFGIGISHSDNSMVTNNLVANNNLGPGIHLFYSSNSILKDNNMTANLWNLRIEADSLSHYVQDIDTSNTLNGKLVYYLINQRDLVIHPSTFPDIGYLGIIDSRAITVRGLHLTNNGEGILLAYTNGSIIENVQVSNNLIGIHLKHSDGNIILNNTISNNEYGIALFYCLSNKIYHNNFINNRPYQVHPVDLLSNVWDNGHPSGGNFWSDYTERYPNATEIDGSGIWDTPYVIDENNQDNYPLIHLHGSICNLDTNLTYLTIQSAIDAPETLDGHTIFVEEGTYYGHVFINKSISLIGENKTTTIIDGHGEETALLISRTQNVSVDSFTIRNGIFGVVLDDSSHTCFRNVDLVGSEYNFRFRGRFWEHFSHDIDTSNTVDYKPIYYWINKQDKEVPIDAGYVALINCSRIVMRNLNLENNYDGITLLNVRNSRVENVSISNTLHGLYLRWNCTNNIIERNFMTNNSVAIVLQRASSNNNVTGNIIMNNNDGIGVDRSLSNNLSRNFISNNENGILLFETRNNIISENDLVNNTWGIRIQDAYNNSIYHNNFINNEYQVYPLSGYTISTNLWDDGYPSGGNYWSDYAGVDLYGGPHQNETGSDGIGDTPYVIGENNRDNYPLMKPWSAAITATIGLDPDTLNLKSRGRWITCYIELPEGYNVSDIDRTTILLNDTIPVDPFWIDKPFESVVGDYDSDGIPDLMVKFSRAALIEYLLGQNMEYENVALTVVGELYDGTSFEGSDMIMAKMPGKAIEKIPSEVDSNDEYVPVMPEFACMLQHC